MAFFHNRTINLLNLHYAINAVAQSGGGAFFSVYLLKSGVSVPGVLLAFVAILIGRFILRSLLLVVGVRTGLRLLVIAGTLLMALQYPILAEVSGVGAVLLGLVLVSALSDTVYWPSYHAYFAALGDAEHRGQQLGMREAVAALVGIVSPLIAGWLLVAFGPLAAFVATAIVQALAAVPLLWTPDVPIARHAPGALRAALRGAPLLVADGLVAACSFIVWQIALFIALGQNYLAYGGALAIAALVGAVGGLVLGRLIDAGHGTKAVWYAVGLLAAVVLLRAGVGDYPVLAVAANALGALVGCLYGPTLMTAVYNQAKRSPCTLRFHIVVEGGWDIGCASGCAITALLVWRGAPLSSGILLALVGAAAVAVLLHRYYAANPSEVLDTALGAGEFQTQPGDAPKI